MLTGAIPFCRKSERQTIRTILGLLHRSSEKIDLDSHLRNAGFKNWLGFSASARDFVKCLLTKQEERYSAPQALKHCWIKGELDTDSETAQSDPELSWSQEEEVLNITFKHEVRG